MTAEEDVAAELDALVLDEDNVSRLRLDAAVARLAKLRLGRTTLAALLRLIERHPDFDFGMPGEVTHLLEQHSRDGYEEELLLSLNRQPRGHTTWMLNRIVNGTKPPEQARYLAALERLSRSADVDVARRAADYLSSHPNESKRRD